MIIEVLKSYLYYSNKHAVMAKEEGLSLLICSSKEFLNTIEYYLKNNQNEFY